MTDRIATCDLSSWQKFGISVEQYNVIDTVEVSCETVLEMDQTAPF